MSPRYQDNPSSGSTPDLCAIKYNVSPKDSNDYRGKLLVMSLDKIESIIDRRYRNVIIFVLLLLGVFFFVQYRRKKLGFNRDALIFALALVMCTFFFYCIFYGDCSGTKKDKQKVAILRERASRGLTPSQVISMFTLLPPDYISGYTRIYSPPKFIYPTDHGMHYEFPTEWYYYIVGLQNKDDPTEQFSCISMIIRQTISPPDIALKEGISGIENQVSQLVCAIGSSKEGSYRQVRQSVLAGSSGLIGFSSSPFNASIGDNYLMSANYTQTGDNIYPPVWHVDDKSTNLGIDLTLQSAGPIIYRGNNGLNPAATEGIGISSYYYSWPRIQTSGTLNFNGRQVNVQGVGWMDHQMFSGLAPIGRIGSNFARSMYNLMLYLGKPAAVAGWDFMENGDTYIFEREHVGVDLTVDKGLKMSDGDSAYFDSKNQKTMLKGATGEITSHTANPDTGALYPNAWTIRHGNKTFTATAIVKSTFIRIQQGILFEGAANITIQEDGSSTVLNGTGWIEGCGYDSGDVSTNNLLRGLDLEGHWV